MHIINSKGKRINITKEDLWKLSLDTVELNCPYNQLTSLPEIPPSLHILYCPYNQLTSLPELPPSLQGLYCPYNQLTSLPELPPSLQGLYCYNNQLTSLPELPPSLQILYCSYNQLTSLPELSPNLQELYCSDNPLDKIYPDLKKETINLCNRTALFVQTKWRIKERVKLCPFHKLGRIHMEEEWEKYSVGFSGICGGNI